MPLLADGAPLRAASVMVVREDGCVNALSFANALFYEENFEENHKRREKGKKAKKRVDIESIRWNERETRRMARVVVKKEWMFLFFTLR